MQHSPLAFNEPVLLFGGPYSNLEAMMALLSEAKRRGISGDRMVCTGDLVAYGADPQAVVDLARAAGVLTLMGNCEEALATGAEDCGCGFDEDSDCAALSTVWYAYSSAHVDRESRAWMAGLPRRLEVSIGGCHFSLTHGGFHHISRFIFASDRAAIAEEMTFAGGSVVAGHCGLPFTVVDRQWVWHNPGVIGMPANDGTPRVWYSVLQPVPGGVEIELAALHYNYGTAAAKMRSAGLPEGYARCLETGYWPSEDVLPRAERAAAGRPLKPSKLIWQPQQAVMA